MEILPGKITCLPDPEICKMQVSNLNRNKNSMFDLVHGLPPIETEILFLKLKVVLSLNFNGK